jgi:hypothetical protein
MMKKKLIIIKKKFYFLSRKKKIFCYFEKNYLLSLKNFQLFQKKIKI